MQFAIPQFTDVEDKLIGPLTLKQFLCLLGTGGVVMFFWSILGLGIIFFLFALPTVVVGLSLTFAKFNGLSFFHYAGPMINFISSPKVMIYRREGVHVSYSKKMNQELGIRNQEPQAAEKVSGSRLQKLAYLLDQKTAEEEKLIEQVK